MTALLDSGQAPREDSLPTRCPAPARVVELDGFAYQTLGPTRPPRRTRAGFYQALANQAALDQGDN